MSFKKSLLLGISCLTLLPWASVSAVNVEVVCGSDSTSNLPMRYVQEYVHPAPATCVVSEPAPGVWPPTVIQRRVAPRRQAAVAVDGALVPPPRTVGEGLVTYPINFAGAEPSAFGIINSFAKSQQAAYDPLAPSLMLRRTGVTDSFVKEVSGILQTIPRNVRQALQKSGYVVTLSRTVPAAIPAASGKQVRGYVQSTTWNNIFGMFDRNSKQIVMAELAESEAAQGQGHLVTLNDARRRLGIMKHECGHAVDQLLNNYSHSAAFNNAYLTGITRLDVTERKMLDYYLQDGWAGKEEAFAEVFAIACGTGCHQDTDAVFRRQFPELVALIGQRVNDIR